MVEAGEGKSVLKYVCETDLLSAFQKLTSLRKQSVLGLD